MTPNWKMLGLPIILTAALAGPVDAQAPDPNYERLSIELKKLSDGLDKVRTEAKDTQLNVASLQASVNDLKGQMGLLRDSIDALRKQLATPPSISAYPPEVSRDLTDLGKQIERLRQDIDEMKRGGPTTALKPVSTDSATVVLVNDFAQEITVQVNQAVYRLQPAERRELPMPAGAFSYWVPLSQRLVQNRVLLPNETLTITVR